LRDLNRNSQEIKRMSIEQKISELLEESKKMKDDLQEEVQEVEEQTETVSEDAVEETSLEEAAGEKMNKIDAEHDEEEVNKDNAKAAAATNTEAAKASASAEMPSTNLKKMKEDVDALLNGEELSEEFREKAETIFEAAVISRVKAETAKLEEAYEGKLTEAKKELEEGLVEKVDGYLGLMVEQWMEQNALALESGMKSEILEGFIGGLKSLFEEHYIDIPEEKFDVLGEMESKIEDLESKLNESVEDSLSMKKELDNMKRINTIDEISEGLTDTEVEKFKGLAEELSYEDVDSFTKKLQTIRESYFTNKAKTEVNSVVTDEPVAETKVLSETMSRYANALGNTSFR